MAKRWSVSQFVEVKANWSIKVGRSAIGSWDRRSKAFERGSLLRVIADRWGGAVATRKAWLLRLLVGFGMAAPLAATAMYFINPLGIHSLDPRQRLTGYGIYRMPSVSMAPTLNPGDVILSDMTYYQEQVPQRGDLVLLWPPGSGSPWVKRVIGLPGESVAIHAGKLSINGNVLAEPYVTTGAPSTPYSLEVAPTTIADDSYYLLGDNRDHSHDSRIWGPIPHDRLAGKVAYVLK